MIEVKYNEKGLIPAIAQDANTGEVLMQAYMNEESLSLTLSTGYATYFSRERQKLWKKGEESGHLQKVKAVYLDCDKDCILLKVEQIGAACHTGNRSCFFNRVQGESVGIEFLGELERTIKDRKQNPEEGSYTSYLFERGIDKIAKKFGEEAVETVIASKNDDKEEFLGECADLVYHMMVLLEEKGASLKDVCEVLSERHG